jgi:hypothetical protein
VIEEAMSQWTLGEVKLSKRVSLKIEIDCGGQLGPSELLATARVLEWVARAARKWQSGVRLVTPDGKQGTKAARAKGATAHAGGTAVRVEGQADAQAHGGTHGHAALQEARESPQAVDAVDPVEAEGRSDQAPTPTRD